jgi:energy-coupling factor transporter ATP-binding protein EcfA2
LLDEPFSHLDEKNSQLAMQVMIGGKQEQGEQELFSLIWSG